MPLFGHKKTRSSQAATLRASTSLSSRLEAVFHDRSVMLRLLLCVFSVALMLVVVEGWRAPFRYRKGDRIEHGIRAKTDFQRLNRFETEQKRNAAESRVPYVFQHDPRPVRQLPDNLRKSLTDIAQAQSLANVPASVRAAFGLTRPDSRPGGPGAPADVMDQEFAILKAAVSGEDGVAGNRIDTLVAEFERMIEPLRIYGLADPADLERNRIPREQNALIVSREPDTDEVVTAIANVLITELVQDTGLLGKSWAKFPELIVIKSPLKRWLLSRSPITLRYDSTATQKARAQARADVEPVTDDYEKNQDLLEPGDVIDAEAEAVLRAEYEAVEASVTVEQRIARAAVVFLMLGLLAVLNGFYLVNFEKRLTGSLRRLAIYLAAMILTVAVARMLSFDPWRADVIPVLATVVVFAVAYNQILAAISALTLCLLVSLSTVGDLQQFIVLMSVSVTAIIPLETVHSRSSLIKIGFVAGMVYFLIWVGTAVSHNQSPRDVLTDVNVLMSGLRGAGWCLVTGYLVAGSLPFIESAFGVVTDISLLEMSDVSHPLLQELVRRAPGTYNHSMTVASIAEAAADRIGADGLLVRVGAYFHDIGKMLKPQYFIENLTEGASSRHEHLAPAMSTLIIIGHVKDGVDLAHQYDLPQPLIDFIEQHHGTTLVEYFYREAARKADEQPDHREEVEESSFRYPGPKPQSREAGVMMLADIVESASRTLTEPTPRRIETLVHELTMKRLLDGQFDESSLTLSEIRTVEQSLVKSLIAIYHGRIKYPQQRTA